MQNQVKIFFTFSLDCLIKGLFLCIESRETNSGVELAKKLTLLPLYF